MKRQGLRHSDKGAQDPLVQLRSYRRAVLRFARAQADDDAQAPALEAQALALRASFTQATRPRGLLGGLGRALRRLPGHVWALKRQVSVCGIVYLAAALFGALAVTYDPLAAHWLLPPSVYDGILARVSHSETWLQGEASLAPGLSGSLLAHNVEAALQAIAFGILWGAGAVLAMVKNGVFLGAVAGLAHARDMDFALWTFIAPHGVLELPAVWLAGGAGLALGEAMLLSAPQGRSQALRQAASHVGPVALGLVPLLAAAALIEGFYSPLPKPAWLSIGSAALLASALLAYLVMGRRSRSAARSTTLAPLRDHSRSASRRSSTSARAALRR